MPNPSRWKEDPDGRGLVVVTLSSWNDFADYVIEVLHNDRAYVYRGQLCNAWQLESSIDRILKGIPITSREKILGSHLEAFSYAARGRRGPNPARFDDENEEWALGQHHGLMTPLLDFTESPFVALYFAFEKESQLDDRSVWVVSEIAAEQISWDILAEMEHDGEIERGSICEVVRPDTHDNPRLVSQRGLFLRGPDGQCIDDWFRKHNKRNTTDYVVRRIDIPNKDRTACLQTLNQMNINHLSLFPDLLGASLYANMQLRIEDY